MRPRAFAGRADQLGEAPDLLQRVTGSGMDAAPYLRYLERKLGELSAAIA